LVARLRRSRRLPVAALEIAPRRPHFPDTVFFSIHAIPEG
jgi:hypothetical protein